MSRRLLAGLVAACAVGAAGVVVAGGPGAVAHPPPGCAFWRVHSLGDLGLSVLSKARLTDGAMERVGILGYRIDALGHAPGSPLSYGLASRGLTGPFADGAHVITIDAKGAVRDLGPVRGPGLPTDRLTGATAGAIHRGDLVVRDGPVLYAIDLDPRSPSYLGLARTTELRPYELARTVDDFDVRDGMLYGVSSHATYYGKVVQIDPLTGRVSYAHGPKLPAGRRYGAALIGPDGALYAAANRITGRSRFYRVDIHGASRPIAVWPGVDSADATSCVTTAPAEPPPPAGGPTATNTRPPEPGQAPTHSSTIAPASGHGPPHTNTIPPASGHGPPHSNTIPPAPGHEPPYSNTIPPASGQAPPHSNTRPQSPGAGPPMSNVLPPMPEISGSVEITLFPPPPGTTGPTTTNVRPPTSPVVPPIPPPPPPQTAPPTTPIPPPPPQAAAPQPPAPPPPKRPKFRQAEAAAPPALDSRAESTEKKRRWGLAVLVMILGAGAAAGRVRHR